MEDQEAATPGRRTRSRAAKSTPAKVEKATPRKGRKKVVLMEVEVSEEEDEILEGKNAEGDESGSDSVEGPAPNKRRKVATEDKNDVKNGDAESQDVNEKTQCTVDASEKEEKTDVECSKINESKMLVVEMDSLNGDGVLKKQDEQKGKSETVINEKAGKSDKVEKIEKSVQMEKKTEKTVEVEKQTEKPVEVEKKTEKTVEVKKKTEKDVEVEKKTEKPIGVKKVEKPVEVEKKAEKPVKVETKSEKPVEVEMKAEKPVEVEMKAEKPTEVEKKAEKPTKVEEKTEKPIEAKNKIEKVTQAEDKTEKPSKVLQKPEKLTEKVTKTEEPAEVMEKRDEPKKTDKVEEKREDKVEEKKEQKVEEKKKDKVEEKKEDKVEEKKEDKVEEKVEEKKEDKVVEKKEAKVEAKKEDKVEEKKEEKLAEVKIEDVKMKPDEKMPEAKGEKDIKTELKESAVEKEKTVDSIQKEDIKMEDGTSQEKKTVETKPTVDPDAENISEDELPAVQAVKVPEAEEVSDEELPGPKRAELPADTEVVSEDELPSVKVEKKEGKKRKLDEAGYDPGSPTSESETPSKKTATESSTEKDKEKSPRPKKLPELDKYWKAVNDDPTDFTGWTYLLQYVDQENDMEAAREAYDAFLSHYPYCYGYWRKYADYEKRKGNKKKCEEVFERGLKAIPLSVDLWIHYLTYVKTTRTSEEEYIRSQFERALLACGLEFRSDRLWDSYIKWETEGKRLQRVTAIYDKLLSTPTQGYTTHFDSFQEHISGNAPNKVIEVDEFLALRKEVRHMLKHDITTEPGAPEKKEEASDAPPGDEEPSKMTSSDEETKAIKDRIISIRRKAHKATVSAVTSRWNYEEGIKRPYFHVKPLERCQLKNWHDYLDYESEQGDRTRIIVLFERCLIACALYEEFWLKFVHYLESVKDSELQPKIRDVYERACTIHHLKKPNLHLQWAMFEEGIGNPSRAAEILVNLEKSVPNVLQIAYRRINLERRRADFEKCSQLYEHYINNSKNKMVSSNIAIKYSRFCLKVVKDISKAQEVLKTAISKDPNNPRLYLQLIDLTLQKVDVTQSEVTEVIDSFLDKDSTDPDQKVLFAQRKLEYLEDFGGDIQSVQQAYESYQKYVKLNKENIKKKEVKSEAATPAKNEKGATQTPAQASSYGNYSSYGNTAQPPYAYSGPQQGQYNYSQYGQGDQYQYQNWQYPQGGYGGYNQWGGYGGGYSY